jgi:CDGSH-type Zn-finger protein
MATFTDNNDKERPVSQILIESGEKIAVCRCFKSKKFPYCDGTHKEHPGTGPVVVESK